MPTEELESDRRSSAAPASKPVRRRATLQKIGAAALDSNPNTVGSYALLASAYALAGLGDKSRAALAQYQKYQPDVTVGSFRSLAPVPLNLTTEKYRQQFERLKDGLRKAGMPG